MGMQCTHKDVKPVLVIGKCEVWGGRETQVMPRADEFECIISLLGHYKPKASKFTISRGSRRVFSQLSAYQQRRNNVLCVDWPDMQAPLLDRGFWMALAEDLGKITGKAAIYCMGGHGRTGTALCALAQVVQHPPAVESGDIIQWIREVYCAEAVETASQVEYLRRELKVVTSVKSGGSKGSGWGPSRALTGFYDDPHRFDEEEEDYRRP